MSRAALPLQLLAGYRAKSSQKQEESRLVVAPLSLSDLEGRLVEVTGLSRAACTSWLVALVARAQAEGETTAWLQVAPAGLSMPYPPDLQAAGVDLRALAVILPPDGKGLLRAADVLLRSGGFGLVVLDLDGIALQPSDGQLGRLLGLCQKHGAVLALLSRTGDAGAGRTAPETSGACLGSLVSLRLQVQRERPDEGRCVVRAEVVKDKRRGPGRIVAVTWRVPEGVFGAT